MTIRNNRRRGSAFLRSRQPRALFYTSSALALSLLHYRPTTMAGEGKREENRSLEQLKEKSSSRPLVKASLPSTRVIMGTNPSAEKLGTSTPRCARAAAAAATAAIPAAAAVPCRRHGRRREDEEEGARRSRLRAAGAGLALLVGAVTL